MATDRPGGRRLTALLVLAAAVLAIGLGATNQQASASLSVAVKAAKKTVKLGNGVRLTIRVRGVSNPASATYRIEAASFPYRSWKRARSAAQVPGARFAVSVNPRVNTRYRVSVRRGKATAMSRAKPLIYVQSIFSESGEFGPNSFTLSEQVFLDASFGRKWARSAKRDRFIYVFQSCGTDSAPKTKYRRLARLRLRVRVSGNTTVLSGGGTVKAICNGTYPTRWIGSWFNATIGKVLRNGDDGYGKPDLSRKNLKRRDQLKLKKVLTLKQARVLFR